VSIPLISVPSSSWLVIREYKREKNFFSSLLLDDDGLSLVCDDVSVGALQCLNITDLKISPQRWLALIINVIGTANEFPGAVYYLAQTLAKEKLRLLLLASVFLLYLLSLFLIISILHISTFESEVFLVQEQDIERACDALRYFYCFCYYYCYFITIITITKTHKES